MSDLQIVPVVYPIISGVLTLGISLFSLFSPFVGTEIEFTKDANWYLSKLQGMRIDKLKRFISEVLNLKVAEDNSEDNRMPYVVDIYEYFSTDMEEIIHLENKIKHFLNKYRITMTSFMIVLWLSVTSIIISLIFKQIIKLNIFLNYIFYFAILLVLVQLFNIIYLRYLFISSQNTYQLHIFRGKEKWNMK